MRPRPFRPVGAATSLDIHDRGRIRLPAGCGTITVKVEDIKGLSASLAVRAVG